MAGEYRKMSNAELRQAVSELIGAEFWLYAQYNSNLEACIHDCTSVAQLAERIQDLGLDHVNGSKDSWQHAGSDQCP